MICLYMCVCVFVYTYQEKKKGGSIAKQADNIYVNIHIYTYTYRGGRGTCNILLTLLAPKTLWTMANLWGSSAGK